MRKLLFITISLSMSLLCTSTIMAQIQQKVELSLIPGFSTFSTNSEKGLSIAGESSYYFTNWINPSLRLGNSSGFKLVDNGMGTYQVSLSYIAINVVFDVLNYKKHKIQLGIGPSFNFEMYNYILGNYFVEEINRNVNEIIANNHFCYSLDYFVRYRNCISDNFQIGLEWGEIGILSSGKVKQSTISISFTSVINAGK